MGYEQKFYIVEKHDDINGIEECNDKCWAEVISMFDYSKDYDLAEFVDTVGKDSNCYIYADDGNTEVFEDDYGDSLKEVDIDYLIGYLEQHEDDYRRYKPFLMLLKAFSECKGSFKDLVVLRYGH